MTQMIPALPRELTEQDLLYKAVLKAARESNWQRLHGTPEAYSKAAARYSELWRDYLYIYIMDEDSD